nr:acyltransferase [uncultured Rhodoferax sp.]
MSDQTSVISRSTNQPLLNLYYTNERLNLDWIRGLAALSVAALHAREINWIGLREFLANSSRYNIFEQLLAYIFSPLVWGSAGVSVFFVLSGYVIHLSAAKNIQKNKNWKLNVKEFYTRRFVRIYSVLIAALILTLILDNITIQIIKNHHKLGQLSIETFLGNILSLQGILVRPFGSNGPLWTLAIEIHFYIIYPLLLLAIRRFSNEMILFFSLIMSLISYKIFQVSTIEVFTSYYFCWILGFYAAELHARDKQLATTFQLTTYSIITTISACILFFHNHYYASILWSVAFFLYLLKLTRTPPKTNYIIRILSIIGIFSYTLYATHEPILIFLNAYLNSGLKFNSIFGTIFNLTITVIFSYFLYFIFERRGVIWLENRTKNQMKSKINK